MWALGGLPGVQRPTPRWDVVLPHLPHARFSHVFHLLFLLFLFIGPFIIIVVVSIGFFQRLDRQARRYRAMDTHAVHQLMCASMASLLIVL